MSIDKDVGEPVRGQFNFFLIQIASTFITGIFLVMWVVIQFGVNWVVNRLEPSGADLIVLRTFQVIEGVTTLIPVIVYYYTDTRITLIRAQKAIAHEEEES